ncbi:MAG TPA: Fe-S protein assembly co-chaperone HscB [Terriglobales bacterium]|nr:Fe-S protein assembly co-chaperone HscB [Terriglobales bacterium]
MNHFEVFDLPRKLGIDAADLQRRYHELSRRHHPDFHQAAPAEEQARVLEASARVNAAYRALRDPIARVEYLVRLEEGGPATAGDAAARKPPAPPDLLAEMFEIQEALQDARMGGLDDAARATLTEQRAALAERYAEVEARLTGELSAAWDAAPPTGRAPVLAAFKEALARRAFLRTVIDDLTDALEGTGEGHVAHHRH